MRASAGELGRVAEGTQLEEALVELDETGEVHPGAEVTSERHDLLDRERELAQLEAAVMRAGDGHGALLLIEGPAGIGKTRLIEAARIIAGRHRADFLGSCGSEFELEHAYGIMRQLFERRLTNLDPAERTEILSGAAALATRVLSAEEGDGGHPVTETTFGPLHGVYWLAANLAVRRPLVMAVDDAQWADAPSLEILLYLAHRVEELPILMVLARRTGEPTSDATMLDALWRTSHAVLVVPRPLGVDAAGRLIAKELAVDPELEFVVACHTRTAGNPFLLRELVAGLRFEGIEPCGAMAQRVAGFTPPAVSRSILTRLARLPGAARVLAEAVAVLGDGAQLREAVALSGLQDADAREAAGSLMRAELFVAASTLSFTHPLVRSAVYDNLTPPDRARRHATAAAVLRELGAEEDWIVRHVFLSDPSGCHEHAAMLRDAARRAKAQGAATTAVVLLGRALREPPPDDELAPTLSEMGMAELIAGDHHSAATHLRRAYDLAANPVEAATHALPLARAVLATSGAEATAMLLERAVSSLGERERELRLALEAEFGFIGCLDITIARRLWTRLDRYEDLPGTTPAERRVLTALGCRHWLEGGRPAQIVADIARRAVQSGHLVEEARGDPVILALASGGLVGTDSVGEAHGLLDGVAQQARALGWIEGFAVAALLRGWLLLREGRLDEAEAEATLTLEAMAGLEATPIRLAARTGAGHWICQIQIERGDFDAALGTFTSQELDRQVGTDWVTVNHSYVRALLDLGHSNYRHALEALERRRQAEAASGLVDPTTPWRALAARIHSVSGERETAVTLAEEQLEIARRWGLARDVGIAMRERAMLERGGRRVQMLTEAAEVLDPTPARLELAKARVFLGAALRGEGRRAPACEQLQRGAELARRCGAAGLLERAMAELRLAGGRPRRVAFSGPESLTPSERRVAKMAAGGVTNRQIAQALFLSKKTIEGHLAQVYRKLDVHDRTQLTDVMLVGQHGN